MASLARPTWVVLLQQEKCCLDNGIADAPPSLFRAIFSPDAHGRSKLQQDTATVQTSLGPEWGPKWLETKRVEGGP